MAIPTKRAVITADASLDMTEVYEQTKHQAWSYVYARVQDKHHAEEILSMVYHKACKTHKQYNPARGNIQSWIIVMARTAIADYYRQQRVTQDIATIQAPAPQEVSPEASIDVATWVRGLSEADREVIALRYYLQWDYAEMSNFLNIPASTLRTRVQRILEAGGQTL